MEQRTLDFAPRARTRDPTSSHRAARDAERSGAIGRQASTLYALIVAHPGCTTRELAEWSRGALDRYQAARRAPELAQRGLVRRIVFESRDVRWEVIS